MERVSWEDAQGFIEELNRREGANVYRLPTEAEWEYAVRAGTQTAYHFGTAANRLGQYGWYEGNSNNRTHPVGGKRPNAWGLYDLHGNVWEWVQDWYGAYPRGLVTDPRGPSSGADRVRIAAGVGTTPPAIAALRIAIGIRRALATTTSASAWREPPNPVRCYPFTLCWGGAAPRAVPKGAQRAAGVGIWGPGAKPLAAAVS